MKSAENSAMTPLDAALAELVELRPADQEAVLAALPLDAAQVLRERLLDRPNTRDSAFTATLHSLSCVEPNDAQDLGALGHLDFGSLPVGLAASLLLGLEASVQQKLLARCMTAERADRVGRVLRHVPQGHMLRSAAELRALFAPGTHPNLEQPRTPDQLPFMTGSRETSGMWSTIASRVKPW